MRKKSAKKIQKQKTMRAALHTYRMSAYTFYLRAILLKHFNYSLLKFGYEWRQTQKFKTSRQIAIRATHKNKGSRNKCVKKSWKKSAFLTKIILNSFRDLRSNKRLWILKLQCIYSNLSERNFCTQHLRTPSEVQRHRSPQYYR